MTRTPRSGPPAPSSAGPVGTPGSSGLAGLGPLAGPAAAPGDEHAEQNGGPRDEPAPSGRARRLTSIAAALALVAVGGAAALGRGSHSVALTLSDGGGWLASERLGLLFHVNGPSGQADAAVTLPGAAGHPLTVLTGFARPAAAAPTDAAPSGPAGTRPSASATTPTPSAAAARAPGAAATGAAADLGAGWPSDQAEAVIVVDDLAGTVWLVDPSLLTISASVALPPGAVVLAAAGDAYAVDAATGRVIRLDPRTLAQLGAPITFPAGLGTAAQTPDGTLWVPVASAGTVVPVRAGTPGTPVPVAPAGDRLDVTTVAGSAVVVDQTAGTVVRLAMDHADAAIRLPDAPATSGAAARLLLPTSTDGQVLALAQPANGELLLADLATGRVSTTTLPAVGAADVDVSALAAATGTGTGAGHQVGAPVSHDGQVYVPDSNAGVVWDFDPKTARFAAPVPVAPVGTPSRISLDVQSGQLWINDETGPTVVLVNGASRRTLLKFGAALPGGLRTNTPRPLPPGPTPTASQSSSQGGGTGAGGTGSGGRPGLIWPGWTPSSRPGTRGDGGGRADGTGRGTGGRGDDRTGAGNGRGGGQPGGQTGEPTGNRPTGPGQPEPPASNTAAPPQPEPTAGQQTPGEPTGSGGPGGGQTGGTDQAGAGGGVGTGGSQAASGAGVDGQSPNQAGDGAPGPADPPAAQPTTAPAPTGPPSGSAGAPGHPTGPATPTPSPGHAPTPPDQGSPRPPGFWLLTADGTVLARGTAQAVASTGADPGAVAIAPTATGRGYWLVDATGAGRPVGDAPAVPAAAGTGTVVAAAAGPTGGGYWTVTATGTVVPHGTLTGYGSLLSAPGAPVVGIAATPTGGGYWLLDAAGGVYPFGDAEAIAPGAQPTGPATGPQRSVGIAASPTGAGYWTVTAAGLVSAHGGAGGYGSASGSSTVVGIAATPSGRGYWLLDTAGGAQAFGDAITTGATAAAGTRVIAVAAAP
ncbi:hypothetical protein [Pseudofrankia inefficax]|uniref:Uncharacterized protein n=1 Tax=Pseudofrankia inefficax (strain DSM 45817 / CECT 9037 / DDB 130130 / EuI1c) TaxID=298654 RepID=E3JA25_PSEI1|nr:hypothetical protein [Pseudofrankia inefficax]ADP78587.1 hypothetical protein FraEuI1c_0504 [Pseudofrankia inefficax]